MSLTLDEVNQLLYAGGAMSVFKFTRSVEDGTKTVGCMMRISLREAPPSPPSVTPAETHPINPPTPTPNSGGDANVMPQYKSKLTLDAADGTTIYGLVINPATGFGAHISEDQPLSKMVS